MSAEAELLLRYDDIWICAMIGVQSMVMKGGMFSNLHIVYRLKLYQETP